VRQAKVLVKNLAIFFLCPNKQFLPIIPSPAAEIFSQKTEETRTKNLVGKEPSFESSLLYLIKFSFSEQESTLHSLPTEPAETELEFLNNLWGARNRVGIGISYRPARLHRLAEYVPWNRFLDSINV
jgi:hypothetical protein